MVRLNNKNFYNRSTEYLNFNSKSAQWWDEEGSFAILHKINPLRIKYIVDQISKYKKIKLNQKRPLNKLNIIDIGCGGGLVCEPLARLGANVTGLDFVKNNIKVAKKHSEKENLKINYSCKNLNNLNSNKKYDVVLLLEVIEHLDDWTKIVLKINKILKKRGIIIFSTINRNLLSKILALFVAEKILRWIPEGTHNYSKLIKPEELISTLKKNKFKIIDLSGLTYNPFFRNWNLSKNNTKVNYFCSAQKTN